MTNKTNKTNAKTNTVDFKVVKKNDMVTMLATILEQPITLSDGLRAEIEEALKKVSSTSKAVFESLILSVKAEIEAAEKAAKKVVNINSKKAVAAENSLKKKSEKVEPKKEETKEEVEEEKPKTKKSLKKSEKSAEKTSDEPKEKKEKKSLFPDTWVDEYGKEYTLNKKQVTIKDLSIAYENGEEREFLVVLKKYTPAKIKKLYGMCHPKDFKFDDDTDVYQPLFFRKANDIAYLLSLYTENVAIFLDSDLIFEDGQEYSLFLNEIPMAIYWSKAEK